MNLRSKSFFLVRKTKGESFNNVMVVFWNRFLWTGSNKNRLKRTSSCGWFCLIN